MKQSYFKLLSNRCIAKSVYEMKLLGDTSGIILPGQFVNIKIDGLFLRRPISICDYDENSLTIIYKVVGKGTSTMSTMSEGAWLDLLVGLGNGFNITDSGKAPLVIGGGVGVPPMYNLAKELSKTGANVTAILGFNAKDEVFYKEKFEEICDRVYVTTVDGSVGTKGFVTDVMKNLEYSYFYTCGPYPMLKAVYDTSKTSGSFSFEEKMGCGFGVCMGCSCKTKYGNKRICADGPVLTKEEIIW
ncbi:MAG: dihydroorotate dehydrogenase electron transfer subunit [Firmicutes bacterium]|nr:dihydroorotate dehydrogenase electron transfer subunit [Bacillota bacterium]